jgi:hypothetical protein
MGSDIRRKNIAGPEDILALNFVRRKTRFVFRRHYKQGLRSHVMEVLDPAALSSEYSGVPEGTVRIFPRAEPIKMFRVFRTRFNKLDDAIQEILRVKTVEKHLAPDFIAHSEEFLVDYIVGRERHLLLCGLQDYVEGEPLDPWSPIQEGLLEELTRRSNPDLSGSGLQSARRRTADFISRMKKMIAEAGIIPDLAGVNNLILTPSGYIKLVDINNISPIGLGVDIPVDDKSYPICDKSVQALSLLEMKLLGGKPDMDDPVFRVFLDSERVAKVKEIEMAFHQSNPKFTPWHQGSE